MRTRLNESGIAQIQIILILVTGVTLLTWRPIGKAEVRGFKANLEMCVMNNIELFTEYFRTAFNNTTSMFLAKSYRTIKIQRYNGMSILCFIIF